VFGSSAGLAGRRALIMSKLGQRETQLLNVLDDLNDQRRAGGYGPPPSGIDTGMLDAIRVIQVVGYAARDGDGNARPFAIPSIIAYRIIRLLQGEDAQKADDLLLRTSRQPWVRFGRCGCVGRTAGVPQ
jgi:hypothetical protein